MKIVKRVGSTIFVLCCLFAIIASPASAAEYSATSTKVHAEGTIKHYSKGTANQSSGNAVIEMSTNVVSTEPQYSFVQIVEEVKIHPTTPGQYAHFQHRVRRVVGFVQVWIGNTFAIDHYYLSTGFVEGVFYEKG